MEGLEGRNVPQDIEQVPAEPPKQRAERVGEVILPNGDKAYKYSDGTIRNWRGQTVPGSKIPNAGHEITHENSRALLARRRLIGLRAQLRGLAKAEGIDPSDVDDELLLQAGSAVEALTLHMAQTFKKSNSLRGMSESYGALISPLVGDRRQKDDEQEDTQPQVSVFIAQFIQMVQSKDVPSDDVIEGQIKD